MLHLIPSKQNHVNRPLIEAVIQGDQCQRGEVDLEKKVRICLNNVFKINVDLLSGGMRYRNYTASICIILLSCKIFKYEIIS